ncbi:MAG TPA: putative DNA modification/repair radical SAM protein [Candidatus Lokiarchaeia archaeon]|nr:putative DNA modification/repair radical SAM protein [Candidatus Lokiarchaeia archaeon]
MANSTLQKLEILGSSAKYDICTSTASCVSHQSTRSSGSSLGVRLPAGCCHVYTADGRCVSLFKVLLTNRCSNDCYYCANATSCLNRSVKTEFTPEELVHVFLEYYKRNYVEGLFLSSGITGDPDVVMHDIIETARLLREQHAFQGYLHMKILPGTSLSNIRALSQYADRISLNLEAPTKGFLSEISGTKDFNSDIMARMTWMHGVDAREKLSAGMTTQMIVGGNEATDHDILKTTNRMYSMFELKRVYYSAFYPVAGSPLEHVAPEPMLREHRLYQADWLLRIYRFDIKDVLPEKDTNLPLDIDPKTNLAMHQFADRFPLEINEATYEDLLRVPGIGPKSARRIIALRKKGDRIEKESALRTLGVVWKRARPFVSINGARHSRLDEWARVEKLNAYLP